MISQKTTGSNIRRSIAWVILTQIIPAKKIISHKTTNPVFRSSINKLFFFRVPSHSFSTRANKNPSKISEAAFACLSCGEHLQQCWCWLECEPGFVWHRLSPCLSSSGPFWAYPERTWHPSEQNTQRKKNNYSLAAMQQLRKRGGAKKREISNSNVFYGLNCY